MPRNLLALVIFFGGLGLVAYRHGTTPSPDPGLLALADRLHVQWVERPAPGFTLPDPDMQTRSLGDFAGKVLLIHFWASWCGTCIPELPEYDRLQHDLGPRGLQVIQISLDEDWDAALSKVDRAGGTTLLIDPEGRVANAYGTEKLPETYLVDRSGRILLRFVANQPWRDPDMRRLIQGFL